MPGFLRRKATVSRTVPVCDARHSVSPSDRLSSDAPPSLPPLSLSSAFADPDPNPHARPSAAAPPVLSVPASAPESLLHDTWDAWKAYTDAPASSAPRLDSPNVTQPVQSVPPTAPASQSTRISGPSVRPHPRISSDFYVRLARNNSVDIPNICNTTAPHPIPVATTQGPRKISTRQVQTRPQVAYPKSDALGNQPLTQQQPRPPSRSSLIRTSSPPAAVRGHAPRAPSFDFEESLSAANVTSVVNQFRSYPPPIRPQTSPAPSSRVPQMVTQHPPSSNAHRNYMLPQKPGSSSGPSSNSQHIDATRRTNGSDCSSTSASSVSAAEVRPPLSLQMDLVAFHKTLGQPISGFTAPGVGSANSGAR